MKKIISSLIFLFAIFSLVKAVSASAPVSHTSKPINLALASSNIGKQDNLTVVKVFSDKVKVSPKVLNVGEIKADSRTKIKPKTIIKTNSKIKKVSNIKPKAKVSSYHKSSKKSVYSRSRTHYTSRYHTTMKWDATTMRYLSHIASFDYSSAIRLKTIQKIERYARLHHVSVITLATLNASTR